MTIDHDAVEAVAAIINRMRAEGIPVDDDDRDEAREALEASGLPQQLRGAVDALREARWYVAAWSDEYASSEGEALLKRIDALIGGQ